MFFASSLFAQLRAVNSQVDFGLVELNVPAEQTVVLENAGIAPLVIGTPRFLTNDRDFFTVSNAGCTALAPAARCSITVRCTPKIAGGFSASLRIPVETPGFPNLTIDFISRGAGVINIGSDTVEAIRVWQSRTIAFLVRKSGAASYDYRINANFEVRQTVFNTLTGAFSYTPDQTQRRPFTITFIAKDAGGSTIAEQTVDVEPIPGYNPEEIPAGLVSAASVPDSISRDYTVIASVADINIDTLNYAPGKLRTVTLIGKTLEFSRNSKNKSIDLNQLLRATETASSAPLDLKELNLIAETVIIRDSLLFRQTSVNIIAKELRFQDENGVRACLTTEPQKKALDALSNQNGVIGLTAGKVNLNIGKFISLKEDGVTPRIVTRFNLKGGDGEDLSSTSTGHNPGAGGDGDSLIVNNFSADAHFLQQYFDAPGGLSGTNSSGVRSEAAGNTGQFVVRQNGQYDWLSPLWFRLSLIHLKDAYLYEKWDYVQNELDEYAISINDALNSPEGKAKSGLDSIDLVQLRDEADEMRQHINQNLDYFGNPFGWAPNLSFEYNASLYTSELDYAIPAIAYIYSVENRVNILQAGKDKLDSLIRFLADRQDTLIVKFNRSNKQVQPTTDEINAIDKETVDLQNQLQQRADALEQQAVSNTKRTGLRRIAQVGGALCRIASIATGNKLLRQIGNGLDAASNMGFTGNLIDQGKSAYNDYQSLEKEWKANGEKLESSLPPNVKDMLNNPQQADQYPSVIGATTGIPIPNSKAVEAVQQSLTDLANLRSSLIKLQSAIQTGAAPDRVVQAELDRLRASDPEFNDLFDRIDKLVVRRGALVARLEQLIADLTFVINELPRIYLAASVISSSHIQANISLDPRVGPMMKDMEKSIRDRVLLYNYWMRKSYEYRVMTPYPYAVNPWNTFDMVRKTIDDSVKSGVIPPSMVSGFKTLFANDLHAIASAIVVGYEKGGSTLSGAPGQYPFTKEQMRALNRGEQVTVNPFEVIPKLRTIDGHAIEDVRIADVTFVINTKIIDTSSSIIPTYSIRADYPANSVVSSKGTDYRFLSGSSIPWRAVKEGDSTRPTKRARSDTSLLRFLLGNNLDIDFFSRPGVNTSLVLLASNKESDRTNCELDTNRPSILRVDYEYREQPTNQQTAFVRTNSTHIMPTILVTADTNLIADKTRRDGNGEMNRTFNNGQLVKMEAVSKYGAWQFDHWEAPDLVTSIVDSSNPVLDLTMNSSGSVKAVYRGPLSSVNLMAVDRTKDSLRVAGKPVLSNDSGQDTIALIAWAAYEDGRAINVSSTSDFNIIGANSNKASIVNSTLKLTKKFDSPDSILVETRFVDNDIEVYDTTVFRVDTANKGSSIRYESPVADEIDARLFPNPTKNTSTLAFTNPVSGKVKIVLYEVTGRTVSTLAQAKYPSGRFVLPVPASGLASGRYVIRIETPRGSASQYFTVSK